MKKNKYVFIKDIYKDKNLFFAKKEPEISNEKSKSIM